MVVLRKTRAVTGSGVGNVTVLNETPTPATDGVTTIFTVANAYVSGTLQPFLDGLKQLSTDFSETTSTTFTMVIAPETAETLAVNYIKQ